MTHQHFQRQVVKIYRLNETDKIEVVRRTKKKTPMVPLLNKRHRHELFQRCFLSDTVLLGKTSIKRLDSFYNYLCQRQAVYRLAGNIVYGRMCILILTKHSSDSTILAVTMTTGSATVVKAVGRDGATDGPLDGDRAEAASASDVDVILTRFKINERTNDR